MIRIYFIVLAALLTGTPVRAQSGPANSKPGEPASSKAAEPASSSNGLRFEELGSAGGLSVSHISSAEKRYIIESMSGGAGLFDCDNDGRLDAVLVNGSSVERFRAGGDPMVTLYRQDKALTFVEITKQAGLTRRGWGMGVAVADYDNDGWLDLYVTGYGGAVLYRNKGQCVFEDVTARAQVAVPGFSSGAAWGDYDRDGHVDLFVARYVLVDINDLPEFGRDRFCRLKGVVMVQCGPWGLPGESDFLFRNRGDGTFEEVSKKAGVHDPAEYFGLGAIWADENNDGWLDLYVANDAGPNYLYRNNKEGTFTDVGLISGAALSGNGIEMGSMGVDFGDFDRDGMLDIFVTNFADQENSLYRNLGAQGYADMSWPAKVGAPSFPLVGWGTAFADFDNDGWADLLVANGHVYPQVDTIPQGARYRQPFLLHRNLGNGKFDEIAAQAGLADVSLASRRGAAFGDVDNDGDVDVLLLNVGEPPTLLLNNLTNRNHWVQFKLEGSKSNRAAIGARVVVRTGKVTQFNEVRGGASYHSQNHLRVHFGLGQEAKIDSVEIRWPSGTVDRLTGISADRLHTVVEGRGVRSNASSTP